MSNSFNNEPSTFTGFLTFTTPAAMSSFLATQKFFTTTPSVDPTTSPPATTPDAVTSVTNTLGDSTSKTSAAGKTTSTRASTKASTSTANTSSPPTSAADATSNTLVASGATVSSSIISTTGSTLSTSFTSPAAASATSGAAGAVSEAKSCTGICSPAMQAAVAVPVTLIGLGIIIALIICARRRRRRRSSDLDSAASNGEPRGSKWARHLRVFSFDAELLIGGRSSRATSVRSQPTTRSHPSQTSLRSHQPSIRSLESPAPPYRDALAATGMQMAMRPESQLTAPPPYIADRASHQANSRLSAISRPVTAASDPFADPDDGDEPTTPVSRRSVVGHSPYQLVGADADADADDVSIISSHADAPSQAGSVRQAEVAQRVGSVRHS